MNHRVRTLSAIVAASLSVVIAVGRGGSAEPATIEPDDTTADETAPTLLPLAPESDRVDLAEPTFSDPTTIDNPLFPISSLRSAVLLGNDEGHPIRIETTLMPATVTLEVDGPPIEALESQFAAFEDGRIHEVATDWYAQADDGSVWYLGEDVFNYEDGVVADTEGSWVVGEDGPPAMIMPADPQRGQVYRSENIPGRIMEEVTVAEVGVTMDGPRGAVEGCIVATENHVLEGVYEDKWFCPGYGEFFSGVGDSLEGMAVAVPVDAAAGAVPEELAAIHDAAVGISEAAAAGDWDAVDSARATIDSAWSAYRSAGGPPSRLVDQMDRALAALAGDGLVPAADGRNVEGTVNAALDVATAVVDLELPFRAVIDIDRDRFEIWARQLVADANREEAVPGFVAGDVATLEWLLRRFGPRLDGETLATIEGQLVDLRAAADGEDVPTAADLAAQLLATITPTD